MSDLIENVVRERLRGGAKINHFYPVKLQVSTWSRDSHELFDYESRHVTSDEFLLSANSRRFYRKNGTVIAASDCPDEIVRKVGSGTQDHPTEYLLKTYCLSDGR